MRTHMISFTQRFDFAIISRIGGVVAPTDPLTNRPVREIRVAEEIVNQNLKTCTKCGITKELERFPNASHDRSKKNSICKPCVKARQRVWSAQIAQMSKIPPLLVETLTCAACEKPKDSTLFGRSVGRKSGITADCLACLRLRDRVRYAQNIEKRRAQAKWGMIKSKFGLTKEQWREIYDSQNGLCAICGDDMNIMWASKKDKRGACVDHDHATGNVRGFLCTRCNQGLGLMRDTPSILEKAAVYLRKHGK